MLMMVSQFEREVRNVEKMKPAIIGYERSFIKKLQIVKACKSWNTKKDWKVEEY